VNGDKTSLSLWERAWVRTLCEWRPQPQHSTASDCNAPLALRNLLCFLRFLLFIPCYVPRAFNPTGGCDVSSKLISFLPGFTLNLSPEVSFIRYQAGVIDLPGGGGPPFAD
jgi:hypothetical protein